MTYRLLVSEPGPGEGTRQSLEPEREKSLLRTLLGLLEEGDCPPPHLQESRPAVWGVGARSLFGGPRARATERMARSGSGSLGIASLHFLALRLATLSLFLQKRRGWPRRIKLRKGHQAQPISACELFPPCSSHIHVHPWVGQVPSSCPRFAYRETEARGPG